eukprot:14918939-Heterocapsa_arctica.AAC.1
MKTIDVSLMLVMDSWRCGSETARYCCPFHAGVAKLTLGVKRLKKRRCNAFAKSMAAFQCD